MVSPLSARLLGVQHPAQTLQFPKANRGAGSPSNNSNNTNSSKNGASSSNHHSRHHHHSHQKRNFSCVVAPSAATTAARAARAARTTTATNKSISGYSADKESNNIGNNINKSNFTPSTFPEFPPGVVSFHQRHGSNSYSNSNNNNGDGDGSSNTSQSNTSFQNCPKRLKKNEIEYAASTLKADLSRAGMNVKPLETNEGSTVTMKDGTSIKLAGVRLVTSKQVTGPFILDSSSSSSPPSPPIRGGCASATATTSDYETLIRAVHDLYPYDPSFATNNRSGSTTKATTTQCNELLKQFQARRERQSVNDAEYDSSTSSVSDTESDTFSDNGNITSGSGSSGRGSGNNTASDSSRTSSNNGRRSVLSSSNGSRRSAKNRILVIPPLLDNSSGAQEKPLRKCANDADSPINVISCPTTAVTMTDMLQLSHEARLVTKSTAPFSVVHANAAFLKMVCKDGAKNVIGTPFSSLLDMDTAPAGLSLMDCMVSSSMGIDTKLSVTKGVPNESQVQNPTKTSVDGSDMTKNNLVDCSMCVSPIVSKEITNREVTSVTHFAISLQQNGMNIDDDLSTSSAPTSPIHERFGGDTMPMEVMG
eukprot:CAMPEP_0113482318 /NCGR_PEP_ID=MMETSP0014_2-20120614/22856_1 /TAXON_ID=2857 /ORGANISM="Nitzschia sp." /LENGTH=591 /DNA_ID=CAMNT_0000375829 /DNA_START=50 /DNA_END=1825 /DNA_ORIENTATION=- /assembly_acc=CAM_ASM_000159